MRDKIVILDMDTYGSISIAKKLRSQGFYTEIERGDLASLDMSRVKGVVWVGREPEMRIVSDKVLNLGVPLLALGTASLEAARMLGAQTEGVAFAEDSAPVKYLAQIIFQNVASGERWFSKVEKLTLPPEIMPIAETSGITIGFCDGSRRIYGLRFSIEKNDLEGTTILTNFAKDICELAPNWSVESFINEAVDDLREHHNGKKIVCSLSGGVDSSVCAALAVRAGLDVMPIFIDTGLARTNVKDIVTEFCVSILEVQPLIVDAWLRVLSALRGLTDQADKERRVAQIINLTIGELLGGDTSRAAIIESVNYTEVLEEDASASLGVPSTFADIVRPIRALFKEEVREAANQLNLPQTITQSQSFPLAGLAERVTGDVNAETIDIVRKADDILEAEIIQIGFERKLRQYYTTLIDPQTIVIRAITTGEKGSAARLPFDSMQNLEEKIRGEIAAVKRVLYDLTSE